MTRSLLTLKDITRKDIYEVFGRTKRDKAKIKAGKTPDVLRRKVIGILFEKPSTRTRVGFESATLRLGGQAIYLASGELQLKRGEPVKDTARILGGYVDGIVARVYAHQTVADLAKFSGVPVINGLSDLAHPTQAICDLFTILEVRGSLDGLTLAYIGDGNNVCNSLLLGCAIVGMNMNVASPKGYEPNADFLKSARNIASGSGSNINIVEGPKEAASNADILYTDTWISMGEEAEKEKKMKAFQGYQVNAGLLKVAAGDALVMHCLPAYRGMEITDDVMEGPQSIIWQQGENKMYSAAGILDFMLS